MRGDRRLAIPLVAGTAAILCCAGPGLVALLAGLGVGAWLIDHGSWLAGLLAVTLAIVAVVARRRRRSRQCTP